VRLSERLFDFEADDGGFTHGGPNDWWEWGVSRSGPERAWSGRKVWGTRLNGDIPGVAECRLDSPEVVLPPGQPHASFYHYLSTPCTSSDGGGKVLFSVDGGAYFRLPDPIANLQTRFLCEATNGEWRKVTIDLSSYAGKRLRVRFDFLSVSRFFVNGGSWYLDDFAISTRPRLCFAPAGGDDDADGVTNAVEIARGASPFRADTDYDGLRDGVETATGVFVGPLDTGSNPLVADTDGGGVPDARELSSARPRSTVRTIASSRCSPGCRSRSANAGTSAH
jgi:bacillopeptidase F (M6 metalloprotease family)